MGRERGDAGEREEGRGRQRVKKRRRVMEPGSSTLGDPSRVLVQERPEGKDLSLTGRSGALWSRAAPPAPGGAGSTPRCPSSRPPAGRPGQASR